MKKILHLVSSAVKNADEECDLAFVPPMVKRRFSPLQKVVFCLLNRVAPKGDEPKIVFASRDGEVKLTHDLVEAFNADGDVSAWKFSSSVYNAAPGLYSVFAGNHSTYTALAAGDETVENSLIEAAFEPGSSVWCYAEESGGGYGAAMRFEDGACVSPDAEKLEVETVENPRAPVSFAEAADFISGRTDELSGRRIVLRRVR